MKRSSLEAIGIPSTPVQTHNNSVKILIAISVFIPRRKKKLCFPDNYLPKSHNYPQSNLISCFFIFSFLKFCKSKVDCNFRKPKNMNTNLIFFFLFKKDYFKVEGSFSSYRLIHLGTFPYQPLYIQMETNTNRKLFQIG